MSFNSTAAANAIKTVLEGLAGMGTVQIGAPPSIGERVEAYVSMGSISTSRKTTGTTEREGRFFVALLYRVEGSESTAEAALMVLVDLFIDALFADLTLAGAVASLEVNSLAADEPEYQLRAGKEFREYPIVVTVTQRSTFATNP